LFNFFTFSKLSVLLFASSFDSSSKLESKWSSMALFVLHVIIIISSHQAEIASSTRYCITGLSMIGNISFGRALLAGRNLVPNQAAGITHFLIFFISISSVDIYTTVL
jgi:hypothetical protein